MVAIDPASAGAPVNFDQTERKEDERVQVDREVEVLRVLPAAVEDRDDGGEHGQQDEQHARHRLEDAALETGRIDERASQKRLHESGRARDLREQRVARRRIERLPCLHRLTSGVSDALCA